MGDRKVLIAIDGSKQSELAFNWYLDHVNRPKDLVLLVHSAEYKVDIGMPGIVADVDAVTKAVKEEDDRIGNLTGNFTETCKKRSILANTLTLKGKKAGEAIVDVASEKGVSMIIMGSRGLGKLRRTVLGSVSEYVIHHAPPNCAVTVLRDS